MNSKKSFPLFPTAPRTLADLRNNFSDSYDTRAQEIFDQRMTDHTNIIKIGLQQLDNLNDELLNQHKNDNCYLTLSNKDYQRIKQQQKVGSKLLSTLEIGNVNVACLEKGYKQMCDNHGAIYEIYEHNSSADQTSGQSKSGVQFSNRECSIKSKIAFQHEKTDLELFENLQNATHDDEKTPIMNR